MHLKGRSKARVSKFQGTLGVLVGIGMILVVLCWFFFKAETLGTIIFFIMWFGIIGASIYQNYTNVVSDEGIPHEEITHDLSIKTDQGSAICYSEKLRNLEKLKEDGLISEQEYKNKRADIMDEDWGS